ncbi:MAG: tRNA 2-selenouridine(34) synthase MnmH [Rhodocyclaceae bacterium]|nr:tRNA 2-selenouridine(34) synthase MnmH [Rhodocyclaceae bacterium]
MASLPEGACLRNSTAVAVDQIDRFDTVIDVRSPSEYALDHVPGAISCPVLDDEERARVGTLYKQVSPFDAKKLGAALVSRNIARHIEERFARQDRDWKPLVYCWRGGKRSGALAHVLREIGWHAATLEGGYKAYRRDIVAQLESLPRQFSFVVVCGATGSGKSRLLEALAERQAQVLDLERLACHRGSVLGDLPEEPQPAQKMFDSLVWQTLKGFVPARPVFVEAESRKIGRLQVGDALLEKMRDGACLRIEAPEAERVRFLIEEYRHFLEHPDALKQKLSCLTGLYGKEVIGRWIAQADAGRWEEMVADLLVNHYDPAYRRSTLSNYRRFEQARVLRLESLAPEAIGVAAADLLSRSESP